VRFWIGEAAIWVYIAFTSLLICVTPIAMLGVPLVAALAGDESPIWPYELVLLLPISVVGLTWVPILKSERRKRGAIHP
jgi:hypothetical protein